MSNLDKKPIVVIFGRTNVGKSTLFNCLIEKKKALVSPIAGTTRDSNIGAVEWRGQTFELVDTGGIMDINYLAAKEDKQKITDIDAKVQIQARDYLKRADLILFLVDTQTGMLPTDREMARLMKKFLPDTNNVILVANKADSQKWRNEIAEFNKLALGEPAAVSAATGSGTGDLLDLMIERLNLISKSNKQYKNNNSDFSIPNSQFSIPNSIRIAIIGKPNVGKSSLINSIIGENRIIVSPIAHTTREPQDIDFKYKNHNFTLVDTAGITKKGQKDVRSAKIRSALERQSITASLSVLRKADIALLVVDAKEGLTVQEAKLVEKILEKKTSLIVVVNKWDLITDIDQKAYTRQVAQSLPFVLWTPVKFVSALTGKHVLKILDTAIEVNEARKIKIDDGALERFLSRIVKKQKPNKLKGVKQPHIYEMKQEGINPPVFSIRIGAKETISFSYIKYIENRLREKFGFLGTPITVYVEKNPRIHGKHD